jgi:hypothetical protein
MTEFQERLAANAYKVGTNNAEEALRLAWKPTRGLPVAWASGATFLHASGDFAPPPKGPERKQAS